MPPKDDPKKAKDAKMNAKGGTDELDIKAMEEKFDPRDKSAAKTKTQEEMMKDKAKPAAPTTAEDEEVVQLTKEGWKKEDGTMASKNAQTVDKDTDSLTFKKPQYPEKKEVIKDSGFEQMTEKKWDTVDKK